MAQVMVSFRTGEDVKTSMGRARREMGLSLTDAIHPAVPSWTAGMSDWNGGAEA